LKEEHPALFAAAQRYEKTDGDKRYTWDSTRTLDEIAALPRREPLPKSDDTDGCAICHL
jgi:hypothetical protein